MLWKIDPLTLNLAQGLYTIVLVEVDLAHPFPDKLLVSRKNKAGKVKEDFFVRVSYEALPKFCTECKIIGHDINFCMKLFRIEDLTCQASQTTMKTRNAKGTHSNNK